MRTCNRCSKKRGIDMFIFVDSEEMCYTCAWYVACMRYPDTALFDHLKKRMKIDKENK